MRKTVVLLTAATMLTATARGQSPCTPSCPGIATAILMSANAALFQTVQSGMAADLDCGAGTTMMCAFCETSNLSMWNADAGRWGPPWGPANAPYQPPSLGCGTGRKTTAWITWWGSQPLGEYNLQSTVYSGGCGSTGAQILLRQNHYFEVVED